MEVGMKMANMFGDKGFEETELRLGLPGDGGGCGMVAQGHYNNYNSNGKRGFEETVNIDLKLNLASKDKSIKACLDLLEDHSKSKPPAMAQVVGWPPVRSYRKNITSAQKTTTTTTTNPDGGDKNITSPPAFVKVSMDGAPYLRKVDLNMYKTYQDLSDALGNMFSSFTIGSCGSQGMKDFMNESKLMDLLNNSDYVPTYEDKDGDWMLVGDVPWEMFVNSCKRLRIMKGKEAIGLAPRAMEKCKSRN